MTIAVPQQPKTTKSNRKQLWKRRLLALGFGLVTSLVLLEITFRIYVAARGWTSNCYVSQLQLIQSHPVNGYELRPGFEFQSGTARIEVNSLGLRSPEPSADRPLIVTLGGSAAFGYLVSNGETAADLLEQKFRSDGIAIEVQNGGVPGYNLNQTIVRFRERIAPLKPDFVLLYLGWNDLPYVVSETPDESRFFRGSSPTAFQELMSHSVAYGFVTSRILKRKPQLVPPPSIPLTPTPAGENRFLTNLKTLADEIEENGAELIVCCPLMAEHPLADRSLFAALSEDANHRARLIELGTWLHDRLEEFARERNAIWIDAWIPPDRTLLGDAIHLTQKGEQTVSELWYETLSRLPQFRGDKTSDYGR